MQVNFNQDNVCNPLNSLGDPFKVLSIIIHYCVCVNVWWQEWQTYKSCNILPISSMKIDWKAIAKHKR